ncbi:dephospho-CoA kinase [Rhizobiales bacterium TNE-4]|nr:dephospho-CoA kinase [Rhizobiales bacterium TNE-4]MBV1828371.1 dephospho-CoA kinase [Rhizobiales bacterium TNE-4]
MIRLGLTGSIGMGKSATATMFREAGIPVHDSDAAVHRLYAGAAAPLIEAAFPGTVKDGVVDRALLGAAVLNNDAAMKKLESIVHPLVTETTLNFLATAEKAGHRLVVLDVPLLFEVGRDRDCDAIVVVSADPSVQRERVLARPGMTEAKFQAIVARQIPDSEKRRRAHFVIDTGRGFEAARRAVKDVIRTLAGR